MLTDGRSIPTNSVLVVDLCIIGGGPAGLTIAQELARPGIDILLLERGDVTEEPDADLTSDLEFESPNFPSPALALHNQFGGMAAIWNCLLPDGVTHAARYLPLDPIDFETRDWVPHSGWPITFDQMAPYYDRARTWCGIASFDFHGPLPDSGRTPLSSPSGALLTRLDQFGPATAFTRQPLVQLTKSGHVQVVTNATAVQVMSGDGADDGMAETSVRAHGGTPFTVRSRFVVVAGGAIENARLLLNSTAQCPAGLGNDFDNVGRFFMDHPRVSLGLGSPSPEGSTRAMDLYQLHMLEGQVFLGKLKLSDTVLRREELLNGNAEIFSNYRYNLPVPYYLSVPQREGLRSAFIALDSIKRRQGLARVPEHLASATRHAVPIARYVSSRYLDRRSRPKLLEWTGAVRGSFELVYQPEQAPNHDNRVTLGQRRDALGNRVARLDWRWSEIDVVSIRRVREILASELRASGLGDLVEPEDDTIHGIFGEVAPMTAHHHLGTTRMHDDPRQGVVDRDCRLHGSSSVYVAGGSVFPTGGYANPTLTVVALAVRLADELKRAMPNA
ncbi:MAG: GMC family oxidoreductase [Acidimicrobiales bacterium]